MPLTPAFTVAQSASNLSNVTFTDVSTGSDVTITARRIYIQKTDGTYLVPDDNPEGQDWIDWALADTSITVSLLSADIAVYILVAWVNSGGSTVVSDTENVGFSGYGETALLDLQDRQISDNQIVNDTGYYANKSKLREELDSASQAISLAGDIYSADECYQRANYIRENSNLFF